MRHDGIELIRQRLGFGFNDPRRWNTDVGQVEEEVRQGVFVKRSKIGRGALSLDGVVSARGTDTRGPDATSDGGRTLHLNAGVPPCVAASRPESRRRC